MIFTLASALTLGVGVWSLVSGDAPKDGSTTASSPGPMPTPAADSCQSQIAGVVSAVLTDAANGDRGTDGSGIGTFTRAQLIRYGASSAIWKDGFMIAAAAEGTMYRSGMAQALADASPKIDAACASISASVD